MCEIAEGQVKKRTIRPQAQCSPYNFGSSFNQVGSFDTRIRLSGNWFLLGQAPTSATRYRNAARLAGPAYFASIRNSGRHFAFASTYTDRSPNFPLLPGTGLRTG